MQNKKTVRIGKYTEEVWCNIYFLVSLSGKWILYRQIVQTVNYKTPRNIYIYRKVVWVFFAFF